MREAFAHNAVLDMEPDADPRAPGAAVTVALCGHWDHEPPCPLAPHHVNADWDGRRLHVRILFAAEPGTEPEVRRRIELALSGRWPLPDGLIPAWQLRSNQTSDITPGEADHAGRLIRT
jgi:hypothetical protein